MATEKEAQLAQVTVVQVFEYMLEHNLDRKHACEALGIPYDTVNHMLARDPSLLKGFLDRQKETLQVNLAQILMAQQDILRKLMLDAGDETLSMTERVSLYNHLAMLQDQFARKLGVETEQEKSAKKYLQGAHLRPGTAKVTRTETTELTFNTEDIESIPIDTVDGKVIESKPPNDFLNPEKE